ncbi:winged helix-turn-helix domain-containing protein [Desulfurispira natronophila]|uniref:DNA-binding response OmpR family regulator n=1 Tax=Desulfurispira natronophila TaxID=682562 RepID=A0A7W8DHK6_9BACT|nr:winged helix-turn-helix domain-containing protein [Desulfurispira natronophila]MBB5022472.1 DNA-binding response OmpR family regulator [Desulfurispira natronophila]
MLCSEIVVIDGTDTSRLDMLVKFLSKYGHRAYAATTLAEVDRVRDENKHISMAVLVSAPSNISMVQVYEHLQQHQPLPVICVLEETTDVDFLGEMDEVMGSGRNLGSFLPQLLQKIKNVSRKLRYGTDAVTSTATVASQAATVRGRHSTMSSRQQGPNSKQQDRTGPKVNRINTRSRNGEAPAVKEKRPQAEGESEPRQGKSGSSKDAAATTAPLYSSKGKSQRNKRQKQEKGTLNHSSDATKAAEKANDNTAPRSKARKGRLQPVEDIYFEDTKVTINRKTEQILVNDQQVNFTASEYILLRYLLENRNRLLSRDDIIQYSNAMSKDTSARSVDAAIRKIRRKIGDEAKEPTVIRTIWGKGYILEETAPDKVASN